MWAPVDHLLGVLMNMLSRKNEFQADAYAVKLGYTKGLQSGLVKLQMENLGNMVRLIDCKNITLVMSLSARGHDPSLCTV